MTDPGHLKWILRFLDDHKYILGEMIQRGKWLFFTRWDTTEYYGEARLINLSYNLLGDPATMLWTSPVVYNYGFSVNITPSSLKDTNVVQTLEVKTLFLGILQHLYFSIYNPLSESDSGELKYVSVPQEVSVDFNISPQKGGKFYVGLMQFSTFDDHRIKPFLDSVLVALKPPTNLTCVSTEDSILLSWRDNSSFETGYIIWRQVEGEEPSIIGKVPRDVNRFVDKDLNYPLGTNLYYWVQADGGGYYSNSSNQVHGVVRLNPPVITSLTFQDSVVVIEWNDNSRKNKDYYVGKKVRGRVAGTGHDTTFWYHMGHYPGDATSFIDTFPIEGENIYRVAAIDSTNHYWYFDYDTIDIPFYKADSFRAVSLPDTSILFRWRDRTYLESAYSLRKDSLTGYMEPPVIPPDSCAFLYSDVDLGMHRYYLVSWQKRDGVYFYWAICDSLDYQWHVDNEPPVLSVYGGGTQKRGFFPMEAVLIKGMCTNIPLDGKRVDKKKPRLL